MKPNSESGIGPSTRFPPHPRTITMEVVNVTRIATDRIAFSTAGYGSRGRVQRAGRPVVRANHTYTGTPTSTITNPGQVVVGR